MQTRTFLGFVFEKGMCCSVLQCVAVCCICICELTLRLTIHNDYSAEFCRYKRSVLLGYACSTVSLLRNLPHYDCSVDLCNICFFRNFQYTMIIVLILNKKACCRAMHAQE